MFIIEWLQRSAAAGPLADLAVELVERVETGGPLPAKAEVEALLDCGPEGQYLEAALAQASA